MVMFDHLMAVWNWKPIRNCPGRYVMCSSASDLSTEDLLGPGIEISMFQVAAARDTVVVADLGNGGLISYRRADGTYLHTLNTAEGFARKLLQLGIELKQKRNCS